MTPDNIAEIGDRIYNDTFRSQYEGEHNGKFLAIDINNEAGYIGTYPEEALDKAKDKNPNGNFYLIKIGSETAFNVGYTGGQRNHDLGWAV